MSRSKVYDVITKPIFDLLEKGENPWRKTWASGSAANLVSKKEYRGFNIMTLGLAGFSSRWWVTYKQAKAKGGSVKKGEKGRPIIFWKKIDKEENGKDKSFFILRYYTVFNTDQCEGLEVPEQEKREFEPIEACEQLVDGYKDCPDIEHKDPNPYYVPAKDVVNMPKEDIFESAEAYYATLFHELGHSTGHADRLEREGVTNTVHFGSHNYSKEELIAEFTAAMLCGVTGINNRETEKNHAGYLESWLKKLQNNKDWLVLAAAQAQKAADYIQDKTDD